MTLHDFLAQRLNRGPVSVAIAAHDAWTAKALHCDRIADGYAEVRSELMTMTASGQAQHYPDLDCWTLPDSTKFEAKKKEHTMPEIMLIKLIEDAMDLYGGDGLWNGNGPCGCGRGDLNPSECLSVDCVIAKSKVATEDDVDDCIEVGDTVWFPIQVKQEKEYYLDENDGLIKTRDVPSVLASNSRMDGSPRPQQCSDGDRPQGAV